MSASINLGGNTKLTLGVKGCLSNQEMELLRQQLAQAAAYDHVPDDKRAERQAKAATGSKPMTKLYRRVEERPEVPSVCAAPAGKKTLPSIQHEQKFRSFDTLTARPPPTKGISVAAKVMLQDEYMTKPREISCVPRALMSNQDGARTEVEAGRSGKRLGPSAIPQVFIM
ncbi:TPA: hypothetical protein N0F65_006057 [Lagenidium giganteum]|uniref:Uncharacterized protein n=1 Tax=Lagenidium giganteum TaxID=4803 RepID=A0AAV2YK00_9STRA|nr:TPA: hypothetical protein N0F65_006057 [Lagenidium giganteum]